VNLWKPFFHTSDITKFNAQYDGLSVKTSTAFHDRFLIIDDKELYLIGASLKDLGRKCFGFTKMENQGTYPSEEWDNFKTIWKHSINRMLSSVFEGSPRKGCS
jgi:hypothetical protein